MRPLLSTEALDETAVRTVVYAGITIHGAPNLTGPSQPLSPRTVNSATAKETKDLRSSQILYKLFKQQQHLRNTNQCVNIAVSLNKPALLRNCISCVL